MAYVPATRPNLVPYLERVMGIEPTWPAWKAGVLPLNYTRLKNPPSECRLAAT